MFNPFDNILKRPDFLQKNEIENILHMEDKYTHALYKFPKSNIFLDMAIFYIIHLYF